MSNQRNYFSTRKRVLLTAVFLALTALFFSWGVPAVFAGTITVDDDGAGCITGSSGTPYAVVYCNIQDAIDDAVDGDTINVLAGTYAESLDVNKELTISGAGASDVTIDASSINDYSIDVSASNVTLEGLTLIGNPTGSAAYGFKIAGPPPTRISNITVQNVVVDNSRRTGIDLNGVDGALIKDVEVKNVPSGNGLAITDSNDIVFENITTSNNAWGGLAIYTYGRYFSLGSDNVTIQGTNSFGEANKVYVQRGNYNNPGSPEPVTNLTVNGFAYTVMNDTFRAGGENFTFYQITQADAIAFALGLATPLDSYVNEIATGDFWVGNGMSIQTASDHAADGDTIHVLAGTFNEQVEISHNDISLLGAGSTDTLLVSTDTCTNTMNSSATAGVRLLGDHSGITVSGLSVSGYDIGIDIGENIGKTISDVTVENVNASDNCVHGILSQAGDTDGVTVNNVTANNNGSGFFAGRGLWFINGTKADINITDSEFNDNRLVGIDISDGDVTGINITGNTVAGNGDSGIGVLGPQGPDSNLVADNTVTDNGRFGIEIKNPDGMTTVSNNTVSLTGPGSDTRDYAGIAVFRRSPGATNADQPSGVNVTGNTVTGFVEPNGDGEGFGILVEGSGMSVTENDVSGNDVGIQVQEGNPTPNTNGTEYFDRGDASVAADVVVNHNNITGNGAGVRAVGTTNITDGTVNWWGDASGPSGEGTGTGDSVSADVTFCPWLDDAFPAGSPTTASGGFATTSTDGHTTKYCTIEEAMFASSGANQEVHVEEGNWPGEVMNRDYTDSPDLVVKAIGDRDNTVIDGITLTGAGFDGLTFINFTITGDAPTPSGYDPGYAVEITNNGNYKDLAFVSNIFDGENEIDAAAIFSNRGWDGFLLDDNQFINFNESPLTPLDDTYYANYSLVFMEAQVYTPEGRGDNFVATDNVFEGITHLNALEAFRWQNVTMNGNMVTGTFGRLLVWSYNTDPLVSVEINDNEIEISAGNDTATSTGIGVYYADADVNITGNQVTGANTCINTTGVTDLELTGNTMTDCATRGHYFSDSDFDADGPDAPYVAPVSALIEGNTFDTGPVGVENAAQTFELDACHNTFIDIDDKRFENPGPFAPCGQITITKFNDKNLDGIQDDNEPGLEGWQFEVISDTETTTYTTDADGVIVVSNLEAAAYEVCEVEQDGWQNTTDLCQDATIEEDGSVSLSFGNFRPKLSPVLECVYTPEGSLTSYALFGYNTRDLTSVSQPIGGDNKFTPAPQDQGQPTAFDPGRQVGVFWVPFTANNLVWTLKHPDTGLGGTATAGLGLNTCGDRRPTGTITIVKEVTDVPETPALDFEFSGDLGHFEVAANDSETFEVGIGRYDVTEQVPANWGLTDVTCEDGDTSDIHNGARINLGIDDEVTCTFTNTPTCDDPEADLTGYIHWDGDKGWVTNHSTAFCSWDVGMASYKKYNEDIDDQILFDYVDGVTVEAGETVMLEIDVPECAIQVDLFRGPVLLSLDGQRYGDRLITARHFVGTGYCGEHPGDVNTLSGFVTINGEALPNVTVEIEKLSGSAADARAATVVGETTTTTNVDGFYRFAGLELGSYRITISGEQLGEATFETFSQVVELDGETVPVTNFAGERTVPTAVTLSAAEANTAEQGTLIAVATTLLLILTTLILWRRNLPPVQREQ